MLSAFRDVKLDSKLSVRNAQESPLLRLLAELRTKIWKFHRAGNELDTGNPWIRTDGTEQAIASNIRHICRQIWLEISAVFYSSTRFIVVAPSVVSPFRFWRKDPQLDIQAIQELDIHGLSMQEIRKHCKEVDRKGLGFFDRFTGLKKIHFAYRSYRVDEGRRTRDYHLKHLIYDWQEQKPDLDLVITIRGLEDHIDKAQLIELEEY